MHNGGGNLLFCDGRQMEGVSVDPFIRMA